MRYCLVIASCCLLSGCWYTQVTNGMVSTRDIELNSHEKDYRVDYSIKICGYDRKHIICVFPTGIPNPQEAIDNALDQAYCDYPVVGLASAQVRKCWFYVPYIYGQDWYSAEGYPIYEVAKKLKTTAPVATENPAMTKRQEPEPPKPDHGKKNTDDELKDLPF